MLTLKGPAPRVRGEMKNLAIIEGGCLAAREGRIVFVGTRDAFEAEVSMEDSATVIDASDRVVTPGFVDCHTHLPFAGSREAEFSRRLAGATYQQIAEEGGGIMSTVQATRQATDEELLDTVLQRMDRMLLEGVTTCEAKSGYGLTVQDELRLLRVLARARELHPMDIVPTFLGAHTVPAEHRQRREDYIRLVIDKMIPAVAADRLAEFCDVFCEQGAFSLQESRRILQAGIKAGLTPRLHADQLTACGGAELAAEVKAASADHLERATDEGLGLMAQAGVPAVLLPGAAFCMREKHSAPARKMIDLGVAVAIATDLNPGTCNSESMQLMIALACLNMGLTAEEAIVAATLNAAVTIRRNETVGTLEAGKLADILVLDVPNYQQLPYRPGINHVNTVVKNGVLVVRDRLLSYEEARDEAAS
ncbi:MAG TPA: imidazolonepropionase [Patescibacteria group bacterium]|nr:imidazolonepropionase [Patescibacteria group bacterium]